MIKSKFKKLYHRERWNVAKELEGVKWYCEHCGCMVDNGIKPSRLAMGERYCGNCDGLLTRRTGGGMSDPFNYFPVKIRVRKNKRGCKDG